MLPRPFAVRAVRPETEDTATLVLESCDGSPFPFVPGQFTMVGRPGFAEVPISISGDPAAPEVLQHTVRAVGDASAALVRSAPGDVVLVRGPYGTGWGTGECAGGDAGCDVVIVAGGIGLAPLRPLVLDVLAHRELYRHVFLVYGSRTPEQLLFQDELAQWRGRFDIDVAVTVDAASSEWRGHVGVVTTVLPASGLDPSSTVAFVCGPEVMMRLTADALCDLGIPSQQVRLSMERNMKCGVGLCGHCQLRELFVCLDGPVFGYDRLRPLLTMAEV